ncbi:S9 family peptidase [Tamlana fucoidanivorans]|uniref:S9 family peptidase n=1 Tax=Allotamlana fucoidanivorans TaxID=2583814 RepID=A0A5C4SM29_9FLAO|nr:S9 family peptidase [Tamlana fucoidanivorans]TNJ44729.1 S9 family peptidase [Tamlana fucoidanivorans]
MKYLKFSCVFCAFITSFLCAQTKELTLEDIWKHGTFQQEYLDVLHSMTNGQQYSVLNFDNVSGATSIDIYDYKTTEKVKTLVSSTDLEVLPYFTNYIFSPDEKKIILAINEASIYRHSVLGHYFVYDVTDKSMMLISKERIQEPTFSPDGTKVAFVKSNNLFVKDLQDGTTTQVTFDGEKNKIINGVADWVYEEEFGFVRAFDWNVDGNKIAFLRFDETQVPEFSMDIYGTDLYPKQQVFKYPKAGEANAIVSLHISNLEKNTVEQIEVGKPYHDFYIPRIKWTNHPDVLSAQYLNRHQNALDLWMINVTSNTANLVIEERDQAYVEVTDNLTFLPNNSFIWTSEKDGFNHIYHYDVSGKLVNQVTKGNWEVTNYYGFDENTERIFYQSVENGSINRDVYAIHLNGRSKTRLTNQLGTNAADFSADFSLFINTYSNATTPTQYTLHSSKTGKLVKVIKDNAALKQTVSEYKLPQKEFSTLSVNGNELNMWMIKPLDFDESKSYPLLMFQYSGPGSQRVSNTWTSSRDYWFQYLAQKGYVIACVDGRGTGYLGANFKKVTYKSLGKFEVEDQIQAAKELGKLPYIDAQSIGIWGWSYGGFMSANCLFKGADVFKMAIAVAPVTSWRFYDSVYTERYLRTPQENSKGYDENSPIWHVDKLKGDFLLIHGSGDDNVHVQNTMRLSEALIQADKDFEMAIYPDKNHGIYGGNTSLHLYRKMTKFIDKTLGKNKGKITQPIN